MFVFFLGHAGMAIESSNRGLRTYCKFLSANDSGETGGHQSGYLISNSILKDVFPDFIKSGIVKHSVKVKWMDAFETDATFTYYESKHEARITGMGRGFQFRGADYTGALFVLVQMSLEYYEAFVLNTDDDINDFLNEFNISPAETNKWIKDNTVSLDYRLEQSIRSFIQQYDDFPKTEIMSKAAQDIHTEVYNNIREAITKPDVRLVDWVNMEYMLFREIESKILLPNLQNGFTDVEEFLSLSKSVLNRRKSRAGKGFEHHLAKLFTLNSLQFEEQVVTEINKKPDFLFPSLAKYRDLTYPSDRLVTLAAKTTCKDRWRQIITESDRLIDKPKFLCTLQQGISAKQMQEMEDAKVVLVVPKQFWTYYPADARGKLWSVKKFIDHIHSIEN